jgi:transposase
LPACAGLTAPFVIDGPINGEWLRTYVEKVLAPTLRPGDIVILDNLSSHKVAGVRATVEARGARLLCLPPYSPDLNPSTDECANYFANAGYRRSS